MAITFIFMPSSESTITLTETYQQVPALYDTLNTHDVAIACKDGLISYKGAFRVANNLDSNKATFIPNEMRTQQICKVNDTYYKFKVLKDVDMLKM